MNAVTTHHWTASDGVYLAWRETGEGRVVILVHGLFSDAGMNWIKFGHAERIAAEGFRVIMPDLRAHGLSGQPHDVANYPQGVLLRDLIELIAHLGVDEFDLGGFSLGSRITIDAVIDGVRPGRAILAGTGIEVLTNWERRCRFFIDAIDGFDTLPRGDPHWLAIQFMRTMKIDLVAARLLLGSLADHDDPGAMAASFTMPTLVIAGADDHDNGSAPDLAAMLPHASYVEIAGTHMSSVTGPELGQAVADFLAGRPNRAA